MLDRAIKKWDLVLLIINSIIGAGIFGLPSKIFALSGVYSLLAFAACAVVVMVFVLCFAEVGSRFDKTGGPYIYALESFGRFPAFLMGWLLILSRIFNFATLVNLLVIYLSFFSASFSDPVTRTGLILLVTLLLTLINHLGIKNTTRVSNVLTIAKLLPLTAFIIIGLFNIQPALFAGSRPPDMSSFSTSVLLLVFAFGGFESTLVNSGEIHNPAKNLPFALITAAITVTVFYCMIQFICIGTLPQLASSEKPLAEAAGIFMGNPGGNIIAAGAVVSILGTLNALLLSASRLPFALGSEGQFSKRFTYIHPRHHTPTWSLLLMSVLIVIISLVWSFLTALTIAAIIRVMIYAIVCASLIKLRKRKQESKEYFRITGGYFFAIAGILFAGWLLLSSKAAEIRDVSLCILAGIIFYLLYTKFKKPTAI